DPVAQADALARQPVGEAIDDPIELPVGPADFAADQRGLVGQARGRAAQHVAHGLAADCRVAHLGFSSSLSVPGIDESAGATMLARRPPVRRRARLARLW